MQLKVSVEDTFSAQHVIRDKTRELLKYETLPEPAQIGKLFPDGLSTNSEIYSPLLGCDGSFVRPGSDVVCVTSAVVSGTGVSSGT